MGLLDGGIAEVFGQVFAEHFLPSTLHQTTLTRTEGGSLVENPSDYPCLAQMDGTTETGGETPLTVYRILVLAHTLPVMPTSDAEFTYNDGTRYTVSSVDMDAAKSHYILSGSKK